jgi:predicted transcriptional regulator of viral defense system
MNMQCTTASVCVVIPWIHTTQAGAAGTVMDMTSFRKLVQWIREEFEAAPDLRLTTREAAAFLGLDLAICERVLSQLLRAGFLDRDGASRYHVVSGFSRTGLQAGQ